MRTAFSGHFPTHDMPSELGSKPSAHEHERPSNTAFAGHGLTSTQLSPSELGSYPPYRSGGRGERWVHSFLRVRAAACGKLTSQPHWPVVALMVACSGQGL